MYISDYDAIKYLMARSVEFSIISTSIFFNYEYYKNIKELSTLLSQQKDFIQCIVSHLDIENSIPFGETQNPALWDYADGIDTINFLLDI